MPKKNLPQDEKSDLVSSRGVSLKDSEWRELDAIADDLGWKPGAVLQYAARHFMKSYRSGEIKTKTKVIQELPEV
jgi:hypothetical protein